MHGMAKDHGEPIALDGRSYNGRIRLILVRSLVDSHSARNQLQRGDREQRSFSAMTAAELYLRSSLSNESNQ